MSFAGDLEHLPIVDVIQLLHSTRKTGTLYLTSHKGESQLVFDDGYIVSANHVRNNIRIGQILLDRGAITSQQLEQALDHQANAGVERKPLIAMLIENGQLRREDAYTGLENLIEMTIVEILTWNSGTFALDVKSALLCDEFRYFPETLKQEIQLNTQSMLMDALRIYDEKMRDGTLRNGAFSAQETFSKDTSSINQGSTVITEEDLGLEDLDTIEKRIPDVFLGLKDYDLAEIHRQKIREAIQDLAPVEQERLLGLLLEFSGTPDSDLRPQSEAPPLAIIIFSNDDFIRHILMTVCRHEKILVFSTDDEASLDMIVDQSFSKELIPLLVIDAPGESASGVSSDKVIALLHQKLERYPQITILQLVAARDCDFPLRALQSGAGSVLFRPFKDEDHKSFVDSTIKFLRAFHVYLQKMFSNSEQRILCQFKECILELDSLREVPDVAFVPLRFASAMFERAITFVVGNNELIAEKGFGIKGDRSTGASPQLLFTVPLEQASVFQDVIRSGRYFYGQCNDQVLRKYLYQEIGEPLSPKILLMPIRTFGRVIALIYGDFGTSSGSPLQIDLLDILARHAGLVLDNNLYRKKFAKSMQKN